MIADSEGDGEGDARLIERARGGDAEALGRLLDRHREVLRAAAARQLRRRVARRLDASDLIQQTYLEAHDNFGQFRGTSDAELASWLRRILVHNIAGAIRDNFAAAKRDARRERPLDAPEGDATGPSPAAAVASGHTSPSHRAIRLEDLLRLGEAIEALPDDQREAVRLRHLEGRSLAEIAERLGRSHSAAAGLIKRGVRALREQLNQSE